MLATAASVAFSFLALALLPLPFLWIGLCWAVAFGIVAARSSRARDVAVALAALFFSVAGVEGALSLQPKRIRYERTVGGEAGRSMSVRHEVLGFTPWPGVRIRDRKFFEDQLVYDAEYTIGPDGMRQAYAGDAAHDGRCILYFGGSDVFGHGLDDEQTVPFQLGRITGYRTLNFGYTYYGPHQMLAAFEDGLVDRVADCEAPLALYQSGTIHISRVVGRQTWGLRGPRFVLGEDGRVERRGSFDDDPVAVWLHETLDRSRIYRQFIGDRNAASEAQIRLFAGVIGAARDRYLERNPDGAFHVIIWGTKHREAVDASLRELDLSFRRIGDILPGYEEDDAPYAIGPHDSHPNAQANRILSEFIVEELLSGGVTNSPKKPAISGP